MGIFASKPYHKDPSAFATQVDASVPVTEESAQKQYKSYDYIIVGAGAAGCVLAHRLSENPNVSVLLIEAGPDHADNSFSHIPFAFSKLFRSPFDWTYYTVPQSTLNNRELFQPRGKMLGGSTSINAMMYQHCSPSDFDEWEKLGATGWAYKDIAPFFRSSEKFTPHVGYADVKPEERGNAGLWQTGYSYCSEVCKESLKAFAEVGVPLNPDVNTIRGSLGATKIQTFIDSNGRRSSTATAYLTPDVVARPNLTIAVSTMTTRILLSNDAVPRAVGVEVATSELAPRFRVAARKEVIISAGALNTPQLLNLSGIGAKDELDKFGIKVVKELPAVGKNLSDHLTAGSATFRTKPGKSLMYMVSDIKALPAVIYWMFTGKGPASSNVGEIAAFVRSQDPNIDFETKVSTPVKIEDTTSGPDAPDLEFITAPVAFLEHGFRQPPAGSECFGILPILLRPLSTGTCTIASTSAFDKAIVDPKYLSHPNDLKILIRGFRLGLKIGHAKALKPMLDFPAAPLTDKTSVFWPALADPETVTDEDIHEHIRREAETLYHPIGTAKIGVDEKTSVVGPDLKVHGIDGLRVVDASIFPAQISGHPTATCVAIAEKASMMIMGA